MSGNSLSLTMAGMKPQMLQKEVPPDGKTLQTGFCLQSEPCGATPEDVSHFPDSGKISEEGILSQSHRAGKHLGKGPDSPLGVLVKCRSKP